MITKDYTLTPGEGKTVILSKVFVGPRLYTGRLVDTVGTVVDSRPRFSLYSVQVEVPGTYTADNLPAELTLYAKKKGGTEEAVAKINLSTKPSASWTIEEIEQFIEEKINEVPRGLGH